MKTVCEKFNYQIDDEQYSIYLIEDRVFIERIGYDNLYYICDVNPNKDKKEFIKDNIDKWFFYVTNETSED